MKDKRSISELRDENKLLKEQLTKLVREKENEVFHYLFDGNNSIMLLVDPEKGDIIRANKAACNFYKYDFSELTRMKITDINPKDKDELHREMGQALNRERNYFMFNHRDSEGVIHDVEVYSGRVVFHEKNVLLSVIHDITEREKAKRALEASQNELNTLFHGISDAIFVHPFQNEGFGRFVKVNKNAILRYGYSEKEFMQISMTDITIKPDADIYSGAEIRSQLARDKTITLETRHKCKNGEIFPVEISSHVAQINGKDFIIAVVRDITDRIKAQNEILEAKNKAERSDRLKTEFLKNMSHEVRTPLNGIIGFTQFLMKPDLSDEKRKYFSGIIVNSSNQLLKIIEDILEISSLETHQAVPETEEFCLNELLMEIFSAFKLEAFEKNLQLNLHKFINHDACLIKTDRFRLHKIISRLVENALKYTHEGSVEIGYKINKPNLSIYVKDTGIGISPENHEVIFKSFSQEFKEMSKKTDGLGIGLSIAKENAAIIGGNINVVSEKGKGSTFTLTIPYKY